MFVFTLSFASILSFPRFFVFQEVAFMLPAFFLLSYKPVFKKPHW